MRFSTFLEWVYFIGFIGILFLDVVTSLDILNGWHVVTGCLIGITYVTIKKIIAIKGY